MAQTLAPPMTKIDANDVAAKLGPEGLREQAEALADIALAEAARQAGLITATELCASYSEYRRAVIEGLLRQGETLNVVAPPKVGKSWLTLSLALCMASGQPWLDRRWFCHPGNVAIIDNELHPETIATRIRAVREAMRLPAEVCDRLWIVPLRGRWKTLANLGPLFQHLRECQPSLVILDCLARFLPEGTSENDNAAMAQVYNQIDQLAATLDNSGIVVIHHSSKGNQAGKGVTDVGRGAGSIGGSTDSHMVLREHEEPSCFVADAVTRTWPKPDPVVLRWEFPLWTATEHDPGKLRGVRPSNAKAKPPDSLDDAAFCTYLTSSWISPRNLIAVIAQRDNYSMHAARALIDGVVGRHGLDELTREDGMRDCGVFLAETNPAGRGIRLKIKGAK